MGIGFNLKGPNTFSHFSRHGGLCKPKKKKRLTCSVASISSGARRRKKDFGLALVLVLIEEIMHQLIGIRYIVNAIFEAGDTFSKLSCLVSMLNFGSVTWVLPPPRMPVANEGLGWDPRS